MTTNAWDLRATALSLVFFNMDKHCLTPAKLLNLHQSVLKENSTKNISFKQWIDINSEDWSTTEKSTSSPIILYKVGFISHTELWHFKSMYTPMLVNYLMTWWVLQSLQFSLILGKVMEFEWVIFRLFGKKENNLELNGSKHSQNIIYFYIVTTLSLLSVSTVPQASEMCQVITLTVKKTQLNHKNEKCHKVNKWVTTYPLQAVTSMEYDWRQNYIEEDFRVKCCFQVHLIIFNIYYLFPKSIGIGLVGQRGISTSAGKTKPQGVWWQW